MHNYTQSILVLLQRQVFSLQLLWFMILSTPTINALNSMINESFGFIVFYYHVLIMPKFKKEKLKIYQKLFQQFDRGERVINGNPQISLSLLE